MEELKLKKCHKCDRELPTTYFNKCKRAKDGLQTVCKKCQSEYLRIYAKKNSKKKQENLLKVYSNPKLAKFQPRELIAELRARGFSGELSIRQTITV